MDNEGYWANVTAALDEVRDGGATVDDVMRILKEHFAPSSTEAFCDGSGGDRGLADVLLNEREDWTTVWYDRHYYWCAKDANGDELSYVEGDVMRGNAKR
jgi:hypothetical protein